jgi:hypothetical protein
MSYIEEKGAIRMQMRSVPSQKCGMLTCSRPNGEVGAKEGTNEQPGRWVEQQEAAGMTAADADKLTERDGRGIGMMMNVSRKYQRKLPCTEASGCRCRRKENGSPGPGQDNWLNECRWHRKIEGPAFKLATEDTNGGGAYHVSAGMTTTDIHPLGASLIPRLSASNVKAEPPQPIGGMAHHLSGPHASGRSG